MCGIIGVIGQNSAPFKVFSGLKRLEYRGYDSWGISFKSCNGIEMVKKVGHISDPPKGSLNHNSYSSIGHTRWATHGKVTEANAHPHFSNNKEISIVHNGIVENFEELKGFLQKEGFEFYSETDTEVLANLIQYFYDQTKNFVQATRSALQKVEGSYAVVAMHKNCFELVAARNGSPLVVGVGEKELFVASDVPAFLPFTKKAVYLDDYEMAVLGKNLRVFETTSGKEVQKKVEEINWDIAQAQKGNFAHFMLKEIFEQPATIKLAVEQPREKIEKISEMIKNARGVFFVGCGSSFNACISSAYLFNNVAKMHVNVVLASEFRNYSDFVNEKTLVIAVSQSGETADVLDAVKTAKRHGAKIVSVLNGMGSSLMRQSDETILMNCGPEICVLSTKTYTSQLAILLLLAYAVAGKEAEGKNLAVKTAKEVEKIIAQNEEKTKLLAKEFKTKKDIFLIGRDLAFPSALEGALKIKEVSYIHAEGF
ncbi:MAG: glutamine--fructose-6-phosphate transaminase (isomerizing), partial [Candidatus Diapherotrites archaeon]|nr:glutamine--fructose-6-phosphate transaminase (isomerizing) [Candidatus Diapherotrites archaeon]